MQTNSTQIFDSFERSFIVRFAFLEHDLILLLQRKEQLLAKKHIQTFCDQMYGPLHHIAPDLLKRSLLGLIGDLASCGFANPNQTLSYLQLRLSLMTFWEPQTIDQTIFLTNLQSTFDAFFAISMPTEQPNKSYVITRNNRKICAYINSHLEEKITIRQIIHELKLPPTSAPKKFKQELGYSITSYLQRVRIELASYWLTETQMKLGAISKRLQFYDEASFSRQFKKLRLATPSQYRKQNQLTVFHPIPSAKK